MAELASVKRLGWSPYLGKTSTLKYVDLLGRNVRAQDFWVPAVEAMNEVLVATGYENPCDWTGSYNKRYISGTTIWSWHSYGGAIDLDYGGDNPDSPDHPLVDNNPHLHRPIPWGDPGFGTEFQLLEHQVKAVLALRTNNGKPLWRWLGTSIGDTMHFEPLCTREDIETGIDPDSIYKENPPMIPMEPGQDFADVPLDHPFYSDIHWMKENGITNGAGTNEYGQPIYRPDDPTKRSHEAAFIHRTYNLITAECEARYLTDVEGIKG